jgi:hypothetical protein
MEAVQTSETSVNSHQSTGRCNPEDGRLQPGCSSERRASLLENDGHLVDCALLSWPDEQKRNVFNNEYKEREIICSATGKASAMCA